MGWRHACVFDARGEATCWGSNEYGQADAPEGRYAAIDAGAFRTCTLTLDGEAACWGDTVYDRYASLYRH